MNHVSNQTQNNLTPVYVGWIVPTEQPEIQKIWKKFQSNPIPYMNINPSHLNHAQKFVMSYLKRSCTDPLFQCCPLAIRVRLLDESFSSVCLLPSKFLEGKKDGDIVQVTIEEGTQTAKLILQQKLPEMTDSEDVNPSFSTVFTNVFTRPPTT